MSTALTPQKWSATNRCQAHGEVSAVPKRNRECEKESFTGNPAAWDTSSANNGDSCSPRYYVSFSAVCLHLEF